MIATLQRIFWEDIPIWGTRISRGFGVFFADGVYLVAFGRFGMWSPLIALAVGILFGIARFGAQDVFSESLPLLITALVLGSISTLHGVLFTTGFGITDLIYQHTTPGYYSNGILSIAALLVTYAVLGGFSAGIPFLASLFRNNTPTLPGISPDAKFLFDILLGGLLQGGLTWLFIQALPLFIRPPYVWLGTSPSVAVAYQVQHFPLLFFTLGAAVGAIRVIAQYLAVSWDIITIDIVLEHVETAIKKGGILDHLPKILTYVIFAATGTLLVSGLLENWWYAIILFAGILGINILRQGITKTIPAWAILMERIPLIIRFPISLLLLYWFATPLIQQFQYQSSFASLFWATIGGIALMAVFFPPVSETARKHAIKTHTPITNDHEDNI